jgi:hypothetical protein
MQTGATATVYQRPETLRAAEVFSDPPINALDVSWPTAELSWGITSRFP